jgi:hypothetical protein
MRREQRCPDSRHRYPGQVCCATTVTGVRLSPSVFRAPYVSDLYESQSNPTRLVLCVMSRRQRLGKRYDTSREYRVFRTTSTHHPLCAYPIQTRYPCQLRLPRVYSNADDGIYSNATSCVTPRFSRCRPMLGAECLLTAAPIAPSCPQDGPLPAAILYFQRPRQSRTASSILCSASPVTRPA